SLVQMVSTLAELCGLPPPAGVDGASMAREISEPQRRRDTAIYAEFAGRTPRAKYMIRRGDYKYSYYVNDMPELYNLREDPDEMRNLALLPQSQSKVDEMQTQLFAWQRPSTEPRP